MVSFARFRSFLPLVFALVLLSAAGCGDNTPKGGGQGGMAGTNPMDGGGGTTGMAGKDGGNDADAMAPDGDAAGDKNEAGEAGDTAGDRNEAGEAGDTAGDRNEAGEAGDVAGDRTEAGPDGVAGAGGAGGVGGAGGAGGVGGAGGAGGVGGAGGAGGVGGAGGAAGNDGGAGSDASPDVPPEVAPPSCYTVAFVKPVNNALLSAADDKDADNCANGFQFDVQINTSAPNGTDVQLFAGATLLKTVQAAAGKADFTGVQFASSGDTNLSIQFPSTSPCTDATTKAKVTVDCSVPACSITKPIISATHPALNGVPVAQGGDRVSAQGSPYQAAFEVTTDIADNQTVALDINDAATPATVTSVSALAAGGKAVFPGVALPPGATYQIQARCTNGNGVVGRSAKGSYPVDATAPDLTISRPNSGDFIGPSGLTNGAFPVCGKTTASDAVNLNPGLGARVSNYCVQTSGSPTCTPATTVGVDTCVNVTCPGDAPFNINVTLTDAAGNPTTQVISGVTCSSTTPTVQIITPLTDAPLFNDPARHLLAATAPQPFHDQQAGTAGAQTDVIACSSRGGMAALFAGHAGDPTLVQVGPAVATADAAGAGCPPGLGFVARFLGVTLPESVENATGMLSTATQLRVDVTDISASTGKSAALDLWVDSTPPTLSLSSPVGLCGSFHQAFATFDTDVVLAADTANVSLTITNGGSTQTRPMPTTFASGMATFSTVMFGQGSSDLAGLATDPAGNTTALPAPCTVTAGIAPVVTFTNPTAANVLCPNGSVAPGCIPDNNPGLAGWQGSITVNALVNGLPITTGNITFTANGAPLGVAALDGSGNATLSNVTLLDGNITITAATDNIAGHGVGTATLTIVVDLGAPDAPTNLTGTVLDRRNTSFQLFWTAPNDNGAPVKGYDVRYARVPITALNFDDPAVTASFAYTGSPSAVGQPDGIAVTGLNIETDYFFAIKSFDAGGSRSPITATSAAVKAVFLTTLITGVGTDGLGTDLNGVGDFGKPDRTFTQDGFSDLVVGDIGGTHVYVYFGAAGGYSTTPSITITGSVANFGAGLADAGDLDGDGLDDLAIASPSDGTGKVFIFSRKNPPASWGTTNAWPATLTDAQANYVLTVDATYGGGMNSLFRRNITRLGDFDGTGPDDLGVGLRLHGGGAGGAVVVRGSSTFTSMTIPDPAAVQTIQIDGTVANAQFGQAIMGIGSFFSGAPPGMIVAGPVGSAVYAFRGQSPAGALTAAGADDSIVGTPSESYGINLGFLGPLGSSPGALTIAATPAKYVEVHLGTVATGPLLGTAAANGSPAASFRLTDSLSGNSFGVINLGGGIKGTSQAVSVLGGDSIPDLVVGGQGEATTPVYIVNGAAMSTFSGNIDVATGLNLTSINAKIVKVPGHFPAGWTGHGGSSIIVHSNDDVYADFAIGESVAGQPGRVVVFY